jgi:hypothetical protein
MVKVKVVGPYQVVYEDKRYVAGDVFDVPPPDAEAWVTAGYVEQVVSTKSATKSDSKSGKADTK